MFKPFRELLIMNKIFLNFILKDVRHYFGFLIKRGYKISDSEYLLEKMGNWGVDLESDKCKIQIYNDRGVINLAFMPLNGDMKSGVSIRAMIYFLTDGKEFVGDLEGHYLTWSKKEQFERLEGLLRAYIDQVEPYFGGKFDNYKNDLMSAQKKYNERLSFERRIPRKNTG